MGLIALLSNPFVLFVVFIVFLVIGWTVFKLITGTLIAGTIGALFPLVLVKVFGYPLELDFLASFTWALIAMATYLAWNVLKGLYESSKLAYRIISFVLSPFTIIFAFFKWLLFSKKKE